MDESEILSASVADQFQLERGRAEHGAIRVGETVRIHVWSMRMRNHFKKVPEITFG